MSQRIGKISAVSAGIAIALGGSPGAFAQQDAVEEIVVTGSHIRRSEFDSRAPIQIVDTADIESIGAAQPVEVLAELTVNSGSQFYNETNDRAGVSQFNIRNLGLGSTLTLLNGKRAGVASVADQTGTDFVDINQFPLAMIQRIEVLTDGASATYGSQAVAGVANIITRKGFEGLEVSGGFSTSEIDTWHMNLAAGMANDNGSINVYATVYDQGHKERSEFDWMRDRLMGQGDISRSRFLSSTGSPGTYRRATIDPATNEAADVRVPNPNYDPNNPASGPQFFGPRSNPDPDCLAAGGVFLNPADLGRQDTLCRYHFVDQVSVISAEERVQVFSEWEWNFNDDVRYYGEASFSNNLILRDSGGATLNTGRANGGGFTIPGDHPFNFYIEDPNDARGLIYIGPDNWDNNVHTGATLRAIARPLGADVNNNDKTQQIHRELLYQRVLQGMEFTLPRDWYVDVSYMWAKASRTTDDPHNYRSNVFQDLVRSGDWNPFGSRLATPGLVSPKDGVTVAGTDQLVLEQFDQRGVSTGRAVEQVYDVVAAGGLFDNSWGTISGAFGAQYRKTQIDSVPDSLSAAGEANEEGISGFVNGTQDVVAFFGEVIVPVTDMAEVQLAVRNEDYGEGISTTDPKISFEFGFNESIGMRGSWGTSFQAPTVRQTASASSSAFLDDPASPTGPGGSTVCTRAGLNNNVTVSVQGAPDLKPQESENFALGLVFQLDQFRASIDYWNFEYTDLIAQSEGPQAIVDAQCPQNDGSPIRNDPRVVRDAGGQLRQVITQFTNIGFVETDGIDINADYTMDVGRGTLNLDGGVTLVNKFDVDSTGDGTIDFDGAGSRNFRNNFSTMPELRGNVGGSYLMGNHTFNLTMRYIDSYKNDQSNDGKVDSWTTLDGQYSLVMPGLIGDGDSVFTIGVNNILDEDPPALTRNNADGTVVTRFNTDGTYNTGWIDRPGYDDRAGHDIRGRIVYFNFKQSF
jgi:iron complex outermembrane recepter protein